MKMSERYIAAGYVPEPVEETESFVSNFHKEVDATEFFFELPVQAYYPVYTFYITGIAQPEEPKCGCAGKCTKNHAEFF